MVYPRSTKEFLRSRLNVFVRFRSNWNLEEFRFLGRGENRSIRRKTSGARERTNKKLWRRTRDLKPGYIDGRRVLLPVTHPCSPIPLLFLIRLFHNSPHLTKQNKNKTVLGAGVHSLPFAMRIFHVGTQHTHDTMQATCRSIELQ